MRTFLRKVLRVITTVNLQNLKAALIYLKKNGLKQFLRNCLSCVRLPEVVDEYAMWINNNEPSQEELNRQREYTSFQELNLEIICRDFENAGIQEQTYCNYTVTNYNDIRKKIMESQSDYIIFLGENIILTPFALYELVRFIEKNDSILLYSDNDKIVDEKRVFPHFKPDYAPDTILSQNYIGDFIAVKTDFLKLHQDILTNLNQNLIYDILLNVSEKTDNIFHIQKVLYHETMEQMPVDTDDERAIIQKHLDRRRIAYESIVDGKYKGHYKVNYSIAGEPLISIVVPNMDHIKDLDLLLSSIQKSTYQNYEVIIVENNSRDKETFEYYNKITEKDTRIKIQVFDISYFNYSAIVNYGVAHSSGEYVILLNNDIEILTPNWIEEMLMYVQRENVGICGVKLYFADRSIQHAGVTIGTRGLAGHRFREIREDDFRADDYINIVQNLSAVTAACFMVKKDLYHELLGFDKKLAVAFNDVDFCLKVRKYGKLIVYNPFVEAYHYESKSRGEDTESKEKTQRFAREYALFVTRWENVIRQGDPYYNRNFCLDTDLPKINYNKIW